MKQKGMAKEINLMGEKAVLLSRSKVAPSDWKKVSQKDNWNWDE